jgi:hypothetical protein
MGILRAARVQYLVVAVMGGVSRRQTCILNGI